MTASVAELLGDSLTNGNSFMQTNLVSSGTVPAELIDPDLINPWGISSPGPGGPFWISDNNSGFTTFYSSSDGATTKDGQVAIANPPGQTAVASPTGQVFNSTSSTSTPGFDISQNGVTDPALFIFATESGTISGWNPDVNATSSVIAVNNSKGGDVNGGDGAVYKGLAIGTDSDGTFLYAANFRNDSVDVFNSKFQLVKSFTDPTVPEGYAPFNVQVLDGKLYVTFAKQDASRHDNVDGAGLGFVDEFSLDGSLIQRVASHGALNAPWGLAIAPAGFGEFSGDLLVGNFGNGNINVFNPTTDAYLGMLDKANGKPFQETDLWALQASGDQILFTAGLANESHGLFGSLSATSAPSMGPMTSDLSGRGWHSDAATGAVYGHGPS